MTDPVEQEKPEKLKKSSWWWPEVVASSLAGAAVLAFRGCWHRKMSWPIGGQGYSYQVCLSWRRQAAVRREKLQRLWSVPL